MGSKQALLLAAAHVERAAPEVAVVVSAMNGVTDLLLEGVMRAAAGHQSAGKQNAEAFYKRHEDVIGELKLPAALKKVARALADEYAAIGHSVYVLRELSPRTRDAAVARGERMLSQIFSALLQKRGVANQLIDSPSVLFCTRDGGVLWPDFARSEKALRAVRPKNAVLVLPGYIASGPDGEVVTLGRGGTDFSAAIVARCLHADEVVLYKEVDGLLTADPKWVEGARVLPALHYREAAELAYYGAKILHPRTMIPLIAKKIPLTIKNTFDLQATGTRISSEAPLRDFPVKALTAISEQALVTIAGNGMIGVPGVAARAFAALSAAGHSVSMISQASSESSICFVVPASEAKDAVRVLKLAFATELQRDLIDAVSAREGIALVAVVGMGMAGTPGIAARTFEALRRERTNVIAIAQGSSELNITVAVEQTHAKAAVRALHAEFQLSKIRPLVSNEREAALAILGYGHIGRALAEQLAQQARHFERELGAKIRCVGVADRRGWVIEDKGISPKELLALAAQKAKGKTLGRAVPVARLWALPARRPILIDLTADETHPLLREAIGHGFAIVVANKKPLAVAQKDYDALFAEARERNVPVRYEATVGAGLPVLDTFRKLNDSGDRIATVLGCFSGTLGFLMTQLEAGVPFSKAVAEAHARGYTEPDPREDLSGTDVARKALILARALGRKIELSEVKTEALFSPELSSNDAKQFLGNLAALDAPFAARMKRARAAKKTLRYVARIGRSAVSVGLEEMPESSPLGRLRGTDNQVVIHSARYKENPLVVTGPGAGASVTASGVLNDIVAIVTGA